MWKELGWLALAGALGTLARFGLSGLVQRVCGSRFPWGTTFVNLTGCFLFGLIWMLAEDRRWIHPQLRLVLLTGFMGAFTTFSTYAFETGALLQAGQGWRAVANAFGQLLAGVLFVFLGLAAGRSL